MRRVKVANDWSVWFEKISIGIAKFQESFLTKRRLVSADKP